MIGLAVAFIENPNNKPQVNHKDSNQFNNHKDNLEWCDNKENQIHSCFAGRRAHLSKRVAIKNKKGETLIVVSSIKVASIVTGVHRSAIRHSVRNNSNYVFEIIGTAKVA